MFIQKLSSQAGIRHGSVFAGARRSQNTQRHFKWCYLLFTEVRERCATMDMDSVKICMTYGLFSIEITRTCNVKQFFILVCICVGRSVRQYHGYSRFDRTRTFGLATVKDSVRQYNVLIEYGHEKKWKYNLPA